MALGVHPLSHLLEHSSLLLGKYRATLVTRCILAEGLSLPQLLALVSAATLKMSSYTIEVVPFASYDWTFEKAGWLNLK